MSRVLVRQIAIHPDGVAIDYIRMPEDARENGLTVTHNIWIPRGEDYEDELDAIEDAAREAVLDALDDLDKLPVPDLREQVKAVADALAEEDDEDEDETPTHSEGETAR